MKNKYTLFIILLLLLAKLTQAQSKFPNYKITVLPIQCNYTKLGSISIIIDSANAPYSFLWSNGEIKSSIENLMPGSYNVNIKNKFGEDTSATYILKEPICEMRGELVFTPNGDGYKDTWSIANFSYYQNSWVLIYNRLGQKVFEHQGLYKPWDGKDLLGTPLPEGTYYYIIYENKTEKKIVKGSVSILR
ncbi:MAG: gliding motility-associated C-terminal domain-containing protein [Bacteroidia bacterium]